MNFNALKYVDELRTAGVPDKQAEAQVRVLADVIDSNLATQQDIKNVHRNIEAQGEATQQDFKDVHRNIEAQGEATQQAIEAQGKATQQEFKDVRRNSEVQGEANKRDLKELEQRMVIKLGSFLVIAAGVIGTLSNLEFFLS